MGERGERYTYTGRYKTETDRKNGTNRQRETVIKRAERQRERKRKTVRKREPE